MRTQIMRAFVAAAATVAMTALGLAGTEPATAAAPQSYAVPATAAADQIHVVTPSDPSGGAPGAGFPVGTVGLFHTDKWNCSGAVLTSESKRLFITAGHCVYNRELKQWGTVETFIPQFAYDHPTNHPTEPYGEFTVERTFYNSQWVNSGDPAYDFAIVEVYDNPNGRLGDLVGGEGLKTGLPKTFDATAIGYPGCDYTWDPQTHNHSGTTSCAQASVSGGTFPSPAFPGCIAFLTLGQFGNGASGGPWLEDFWPSSSSVTGYVSGVESNGGVVGPSSGAESPYFGDAVWNMYQYANQYANSHP